MKGLQSLSWVICRGLLAFVPRLVGKEEEQAYTYVLPWPESLQKQQVATFA